MTIEPKHITNLMSSDEEDIVDVLAKKFDRSKTDVIGQSRKKEIVFVRDLIAYFLKEYGGMSYPVIGKLLGNRNHTTIMHAYKKIQGRLKINPNYLGKFDNQINVSKNIYKRREQIEKEIMPAELEFAKKIVQSKKYQYKNIPARSIKVLELYREGLNLSNIGGIIGVSRERTRQILNTTITQSGINEAVSKGITINNDIAMEEERKKHQQKIIELKPKKNNKIKQKRWSRYHFACVKCGTTTIPHLRQGLCERCLDQYRDPVLREEVISKHDKRCDECHITQENCIIKFGRDFYITKSEKVLCKNCFLKNAGELLGSYKHHEWSRYYKMCLQCGTNNTPHYKKGLCENCGKGKTKKTRSLQIIANGAQCANCHITRSEAKSRYSCDLYLTNADILLCKKCFLNTTVKRAREGRQHKKYPTKNF